MVVDIQKLVIGQEVNMVSGYGFNKGKVVKIEPASVIVELVPLGEGYSFRPDLIRFGADGKACDSRDILKSGPNMGRGGIPGTHEGGPWELDLPADV